jgi:hypothetical protein
MVQHDAAAERFDVRLIFLQGAFPYQLEFLPPEMRWDLARAARGLFLPFWFGHLFENFFCEGFGFVLPPPTTPQRNEKVVEGLCFSTKGIVLRLGSVLCLEDRAGQRAFGTAGKILHSLYNPGGFRIAIWSDVCQKYFTS